ncbi:hypothetical protein PQR72_41930 [Paraburkholderia madseniana]|uniref:hypothetical protein n=1 Tax=Paraburkholderia madseniana TaxID=2599607 RepID=UPI0015C547E1|nr:hypothetical protein [Paraburkholderia madseniana]NPT70837.1 hypothetical protein [Paraburkholderia madseniana]
MGTTQEAKGNIAVSKNDQATKFQNDDFVRIGMDAVFHLDVLKPALPEGETGNGPPDAGSKKQMTLDLDDV